MNAPPPVHKGRKGGALWEELLHTLPADPSTLPFFREDPAAVAAAEARKAEVLAQIKARERVDGLGRHRAKRENCWISKETRRISF